jgi:hypothetical protein
VRITSSGRRRAHRQHTRGRGRVPGEPSTPAGRAPASGRSARTARHRERYLPRLAPFLPGAYTELPIRETEAAAQFDRCGASRTAAKMSDVDGRRAVAR